MSEAISIKYLFSLFVKVGESSNNNLMVVNRLEEILRSLEEIDIGQRQWNVKEFLKDTSPFNHNKRRRTMCETSNITKYNILGMLNEPLTLNSLMKIAYMIGQHTATNGERENVGCILDTLFYLKILVI